MHRPGRNVLDLVHQYVDCRFGQNRHDPQPERHCQQQSGMLVSGQRFTDSAAHIHETRVDPGQERNQADVGKHQAQDDTTQFLRGQGEKLCYSSYHEGGENRSQSERHVTNLTGSLFGQRRQRAEIQYFRGGNVAGNLSQPKDDGGN